MYHLQGVRVQMICIMYKLELYYGTYVPRYIVLDDSQFQVGRFPTK